MRSNCFVRLQLVSQKPITLLLLLVSAWSNSSVAQESAVDFSTLSEEEQRQVQIAERFLTVLERSPRRGTALDRVYGHHVEFGLLDEFLQKLRQRVVDDPRGGVGWMLLGMFEAQRGEDARAVDAFQKAEEHRPDDALASYYLGQSLLLIGQPERAIAAFERAIQRNPRRADLLEIFRQLGRVHQRAQRTDEALKIWERLEDLFPDDPRVQEQIAVTLVEEGEYKLALPRYEKLVTMVRDDYRRVVYQIEVAELKIRDGKRQEGLADFEQLLANLNPTGWLHRDVRRRIEEVFLRSGDQDGLVEYYESWLSRNTEDVGAMSRLSRFLASAARVPEATEWMEKALTLAPSRTDLRKAFIDQLVDDQRYAEASKQYEHLVRAAPGNQDVLRDWGRLVMRDKSVDVQRRRAQAAEIWNQILDIRPDDALTTAQVADLYRQSNIDDKALELYQRAIQLAPDDPQYREYLGEYYHILKRPDEALAAWRQIASGSRRTALNVTRLAEVYNSFGYLDEAVQEIADACDLDTKDFTLHLKASDYHTRAGKYDEALAFLGRAGELAANDEDQEATLNQRIEIYRSSRQLEEETAKLAQSLDADSPAQQWHTLARYYEADRRWAEANDAVNQALARDENSVAFLGTRARIAELSGDYATAATTNRKLSEVDRRSRSDHLMNVARLEAQLGRTDEALQAGKDLIVAAPGNTDNYEFYAQLCFQLGQMEEGLDALRKAVRINPTEPALIMSLGSALSREFRTDEAIEVYWRAFEKTDEIEDKTHLTQRLTELYLQLNQFDKFIERFERDRRDDARRRDMTICLAQAHHSAGDFGTARMELESLLSENTRDTNLLQQLSKLCEQESDLDGAVDYQQQLVSIAPGHETEYRLATLLQLRGDHDEASEIFVRLTRREENPGRLLRSLDSLIRQSSFESVIAVTEPLLSEQRDDWELLYREGVAWAFLERFDEAKDRFERLLTLTTPHDKLGRAAEEKFKQDQARARSNNLRGIQTTMPKRQSPLEMLSSSGAVRQAVGLDPDRTYYLGSQMPTVWMPEAFGHARMAAYAWLMRIEQETEFERGAAAQSQESEESGGDAANHAEAKSSPPQFPATRLDQVREAAELVDADRNTLYDAMYVAQLETDLDDVFRIAGRLARRGGKDEKQFYLSALRTRHINSDMQNPTGRNQKPQKVPLGDEALDLMMECVESLQSEKTLLQDATAQGGQVIVSNGQVYVMIGGSYQQISGVVPYTIGAVAEELRLAGRGEQAAQLVQKMIDEAASSGELVGAMSVLFDQDDFEQLEALHLKWREAGLDEISNAPAAPSGRGRSRSSQQTTSPTTSGANLLVRWMGQLGAKEENERVLQILDRSLDLVIEEGKKNRADRSRRRPARTQARRGASFRLYYGDEGIYARLDYPSPNEYINNAGLMLLRQAFEVFQRNDVESDLVDRLRQRVQAARDADSDGTIYPQLMLGYVLWWMEERDEAVDVLTAATRKLPDDPSFRLEIAGLHLAVGDPDSALEIVESITPRDQQLVQQRELLALQLAERLGDIQRARRAAERLFGLRLDTNTQLVLVEQMRRLGMLDMAEAVVARVQRRSGGQLNSLPQLMTLYQGQGKIDLAQQIAHSILRRTKPPLSMMASSTRNPFRYINSRNANRAQAIQLLHQTGALTELIRRLEGQLQRSPDSLRNYEQLIEFHQVSNDRERVKELLEQGIEHLPDAISMRYQLAKHLEQVGNTKQACDHYLVVLERRPSWITDQLYEVRRTFERANRTIDLLKAFDGINIKAIGQPYYVIDLATNLLRGRGGASNNENQEIALKLFERVFNTFPTYRNQMVTRLYDAELWKNPRIFEMGKRGIIPSSGQVVSNPWFGVDQIYSWSGDGRVNAMFHQMLNGTAGTDRAEELRQEIEKAVRQLPHWYGGEAMLALIDFKSNKRDEAKQRLETLLADDERIESMPPHAGWIIGQELDQFQDTRDIARRLFEHAATSSETIDNLQFSPIVRLIDLYEQAGRQEDARQLLLRKSRERRNVGFDDDYYNAIRIGNSVWIANKLRTIGYPVDSVKLYREVLDTPAETLEAAQRYGYTDNAAGQAKKGLEDSMSALTEANAGEAMRELLAVREDAKAGEPILDLMLRIPTTKSLQKESMSSQLMAMLDSISGQAEIAKSIDKRLAELQQLHPDDLSGAAARALFALRRNNGSADDALQSLLSAVADNPLDDLPEGRRPNMRQRRQAKQRVPLWLVARDCLQSEDRQDVGTALAEEALAGAQRQLLNDEAIAILYEWGDRAIEQGDRELAERKWSELLDLVTRRPERQQDREPSPSNPVTPPVNRSGAAERWRPERPDRQARIQLATILFGQVAVPTSSASPDASASRSAQAKTADLQRVSPLTLTQFRTTIEIALAAARNDMVELSKRAIRKSLEGGMPVPDLATASVGNTPRYVVMTPTPQLMSSAGAATVDTGPIETEVAESLRKVFRVWESQEGYPATEVYEILHPIVLPRARSTEIMMYADSEGLNDARTRSLGVTLVRWADLAGQLDDLSRRIDARRNHPNASVPALVLLTHIAMARQQPDVARTCLEELDRSIRERPMQPMVQLACHAAIPAAEIEQLEADAYQILRFAVQQQYSQPDRSGDTTIGELVGMVNEYLAKTGDADSIREFFDAYLLSRQADYSRYSGDYGNYRQQMDTARIADEAAKTGAVETAMEFIGRVVDIDLTEYGRPSVTASLAAITRQLGTLPASQRFQRWHDWTMPNEGRRTIRFVAEFAPMIVAPDAFLDDQAKRWKSNDTSFFCNMSELVSAAYEAGMLSSLIDQARQAHDAELPNAQFLLAIALVADGQIEEARPLVEGMIDTMPDRVKQQPGQPRPDVLPDYAVFRWCMARSPQSSQLYRDGMPVLLACAKQVSNRRVVANIPIDLARREAKDVNVDLAAHRDPKLKHWFAAATQGSPLDGTQSWWAVQDDQVLHVNSPTDHTFLHFMYPLVGDFAFQFDGYEGEWAESDAGFGGAIVESQAWGSQMRVTSVAGHETIYRRKPYTRDRERYGSVKVESKDGKLRYWLNNYVVYEETLGSSSPWFVLFTEGPRLTSFKNIRLTGDPTIPREVELISGDSMDGWNTNAFRESQPRRRLMAEPVSGDPNDYNTRNRNQEPTEYDWEAKSGVLTARAKSESSDSDQSWAYYHRPLRDRESFRYEFYFEPGTTVAYPTIGHLAMMLRPDGVRSHWITMPRLDDISAGLDDDNEIVEAGAQRGSALPLNEREWNRVELRLADGVLRLTLNDQLVFQRPTDDLADTRFGLFRTQQQELRVRHAVLSGDWPESITDTIRHDLLATTAATPVDISRIVNRIVFDKYAGPNVRGIADALSSMSDEQAYDFLKKWVLPSDTHETLRLDFDFPRRSNAERGELLCPAIKLVDIAGRIQRLDELQDDVDAISASDLVSEHLKQAMQALLALRANDVEQARALLASIYQPSEEGLPDFMKRWQRQADFVVAWQAAKGPATRLAADDLAQQLLAREREKVTDERFRRRVATLAGYTRQQLAGQPTPSRLTQWHAVAYEKPESRDHGDRPSSWQYSRGTLQHVPGETWTQLFFQSPLRGNFEIRAERSTHGHQETHIAYGMHAAEPEHDLSAVTVTKLMHNARNTGGTLSIPHWSDLMGEFRIVVNGNRITTFTNGVEIHEEQLRTVPDPWVVLQADSPHLSGIVNNLRIIGAPEIPDEIRLLEVAGLASWRADMFGESISVDGSSENAPWWLVGEELHARLHENNSGRDRESLLRYQRPMIEDGVVEFQVYYVPGQFEVHPAVGRTVFMIAKDGAKIHRLTDGQWEPADGLAVDNEIAWTTQAVPLVEDDWNDYRLQLVGDVVTLSVNEQVIGDYQLSERPNSRFFGLFRYADRTGARVRNVVYRGDWPKELPSIATQQLAYPDEGPFPSPSSATATTIPLNGSVDQLNRAGGRAVGPSDQLSFGAEGMRLSMQDADGWQSWPGIRFGTALKGDIEIVAEYRDLQLSPADEGWGTGFTLHVQLDDVGATMAEVGVSLNDVGEMIAKCVRQHDLPDGQRHTDVRRLTQEYRSGRLKLIRTGGNIHCLIAPPDGGFRLLHSFAVGSAPIREFAVQGKCSDKVGKVDVVVTGLTLIKSNLADSQTVSQKTSKRDTRVVSQPIE